MAKLVTDVAFDMTPTGNMNLHGLLKGKDARFNEHHTDALRAHFVIECIRKSLKSIFGRGIVSCVSRRQEPGDRAHVNYSTLSRGAHRRQNSARHSHGTEYVRVEHLLHL